VRFTLRLTHSRPDAHAALLGCLKRPEKPFAYEFLAHAATGIGDLDGDGILDMAVGANLDDDGGTDKGALWVLFMSPVSVGFRVDPNADLSSYFSGNY